MKYIKPIVIVSIASYLYIIIAEYLFGMSCPFRIFLGISCPGCGMSRAVNAVFHLHFKDAFYYHPLIVLLPLIIYLLIRITIGKINKRIIQLLILLVVCFLVVYLARIYLHSDVLVFNYFDGFLYKISHNIIK